MSLTMLKTLFAQKTWANAELYDCMAKVDPAYHAEPLHTAIRTLNHIYVVDRIFRAHLVGEAHNYTQSNTVVTPTLAELHFAAAETDLWFESYLAALDAASAGRKPDVSLYRWRCRAHDARGNAVPRAHPRGLSPRQCGPGAQGHCRHATA